MENMIATLHNLACSGNRTAEVEFRQIAMAPLIRIVRREVKLGNKSGLLERLLPEESLPGLEWSASDVVIKQVANKALDALLRNNSGCVTHSPYATPRHTVSDNPLETVIS